MLQIEDAVHFADETDRATHIEEEANEAAVQAVRERAAPESHPDFDGKHCLDCDEAIPKVRLAMGRIRCVNCQTVKEAKSRLYARG